MLPGCAAWGYSREQALEALQSGATLYVEDKLACGEEIPEEEFTVSGGLTVEITITAVSV